MTHTTDRKAIFTAAARAQDAAGFLNAFQTQALSCAAGEDRAAA